MSGETDPAFNNRNVGAVDALQEQALYQQLRQFAAHHLRSYGEQANVTLQPTALLHEAWIKLQAQQDCHWKSRSHFLASASRVMRNILVDHFRGRMAQKRAGDQQRVDFAVAELTSGSQSGLDPEMLLAVHSALHNLEQLDVRKARVVELRYFAGLELEEVAEALEVSLATVKRDWQFSKSWLFRELTMSRPEN